jgi:hypothetical protein
VGSSSGVLKVIFAFLGLAPFATCAGPLAHAVVHLHDRRAIETTAADVLAIADAHQHWIAVAGSAIKWGARRVVTDDGRTLLQVPEEWSPCRGEALVTPPNEQWWYTRCGTQGGRFVISLASDRRPNATLYSEKDSGDTRGWLPLFGSEPGGVLIKAMNGDDTDLLAFLVAAEGVTELGSIRRRHAEEIVRSRWQAIRIGDDRVLVAFLEGPSAVTLYTFSAGDIVTARLPFPPNTTYSSIAMAADDAGNVAVVAATASGAVGLVLRDGEAPSDVHAILTSAVGLENLRLVASGKTFVVAGTTQDGTIAIGEFGPKHVDESAIDAGGRVGDGDVFDVVAKADGDTALYWSAAGRFFARELPSDPVAYLLTAEAAERFEAWLAGAALR